MVYILAFFPPTHFLSGTHQARHQSDEPINKWTSEFRRFTRLIPPVSRVLEGGG